MGQLKKKSESVSRRDREVTISLVVVSVCFCLCLGGLGVLARLSLILADSNPSLANLINYIRKLPAVINNSMNFYAYFLSSRFFRDTFYEVIHSHRLFSCCCVRGHNNTRSRTHAMRTSSRAQKAASVASYKKSRAGITAL